MIPFTFQYFLGSNTSSASTSEEPIPKIIPRQMTEAEALLAPQVLSHLTDAHCHPTNATDEEMEKVTYKMCVMSMHQKDQQQVQELARKYPQKVIPFFGFHPWFTHFIAIKRGCSKEQHYRSLFLSKAHTPKQVQEFQDLLPHLPPPIYLDDVIQELRELLTLFPRANVGEVGLDKIFRVSHDYYASPRVLTSFHIPMSHQLEILSAQIDLAVEMRRHVSIHSVRAQLPTVELLKHMAIKHGSDWRKISIQLHSCGLSPQMWADLHVKHTNIFLSLSVLVNKRTSTYLELLKCCDANRILVESDMNQVDECIALTCEMVREIAKIRGWAVETEWSQENYTLWRAPKAVHRLEKNFKLFLAGNHGQPLNRKKGVFFDFDLNLY